MTGRIIHYEIEVNAPLEKIWNAWTTSEGITLFFSPKACVELWPGGKFEMYFMLDNPEGLQGSEDCKVLSYLPMKMLSFSWNAPPDNPTVRKERTWVVLQFEESASGSVHVTFDNLGYLNGPDWDRAYDYFVRAWKSVLDSLKRSLE